MEIISPGGSWIYILLTSNDYKCCKIGRSIDPLKRFRQLRTGDPSLGLVVAYYIPQQSIASSTLESLVHQYFQDYRILTHEGTKSEWFMVNPEEAQIQVEGLLEEWCEQTIKSAGDIDFKSLTRFYESDLISMFEPDPHEAQLAKDLAGLN